MQFSTQLHRQALLCFFPIISLFGNDLFGKCAILCLFPLDNDMCQLDPMAER